MLKDIWRFRFSTIPGSFVSIILLIVAFGIFYILFTNSNYDNFFSYFLTKRVLGLIKFTILQAFLSTLISIIIGLLIAWAIAHQDRFYARKFFIALLSSSLVLPTLVVVFGIISIFGNNGWLNKVSLFLFDYSFGNFIYGLSGILIAHVYLNASFAARGFLYAFESIPHEKYKVAKNLNFSIFKRFLLVEFPALKLSIRNISSTIFLLCFTSFVIVLTLGGSPSYNTLEVAIYEAINMDFDIPLALKFAMIQLFITAILVGITANFKPETLHTEVKNSKFNWSESRVVVIFQSLIITIFGLFFTLPILSVIIDGFGANLISIIKNKLFLKSLFTSLSLATISSLITVIFTILICNSKISFNIEYRVKKTKISNFINFTISLLGNMYLIIPSLLIGLGFFLLSQKYQAPFFSWALIAIICANVLMSLPFTIPLIYPLAYKIARRHDKLSFSLNLRGYRRWIYCELPYLQSSIAYIFSLSFCLSLGDLGVIALFGNDEITTIPWYLYQLIGSYRIEEGSGVALILLMLTLSIFILVPKILEREKNA